MNRRNFLSTLPLGFAALSGQIRGAKAAPRAILNSPLLRHLTNQQSDTDKVLVIIWLNGGNDGLNTIIPFENPRYDTLRANTGYATSAEKKLLNFRVRDDLALNPHFGKVWPLWQEGKFAIVQNVGIENHNLSHFRALDIWNAASDTDILEPTGWVARWMELEYPLFPQELPDDPIALNFYPAESSVFLGRRGMIDILVKDVANFVSPGYADPEALDTFGGDELNFVNQLFTATDKYEKRFNNLFPTPPAALVDYPQTGFANQLKNISACIRGGLKTRVYFAGLGDFDNHFFQFSKDPSVAGHAQCLKDLSEAIFAFQRDIEAGGVADRVLGMTYSEFGRRVSENGSWSSGTDHGTTAPQFLFGTSVNGDVYGHHPELDVLDNNFDPYNEFEFRQVYASALSDWFGVSPEVQNVILTPGKPNAPFATEFPINGTNRKSRLIRTAGSGVEEFVENSQLTIYPNPCIREMRLSLSLAESQQVTLDLFDIAGKRLRTLVSSTMPSGSTRLSFDLRGLPAGNYLVRMQSGALTLAVAKCTKL